MRKSGLCLLLFIHSLYIIAQGPSCLNATPFCTGSNSSFSAATNVPAPTGAYFDCLWTQPNPAWYILEISSPGLLTINIQGIGPGGGTNDIDFICWGPFTDPTTMCNQLTAANVEDCSYNPTWNEFCNITSASVGDYYVLLITNYSNSAGSINLSTTGNATTDCCISGDAGIDNNISRCDSDVSFNMISQLGGSPLSGGAWYNPLNISCSSTFNPASSSSGTYSYIVQGNPLPGAPASTSCPNDTSFLAITVHTSPIVTLATFSNLCDNENAITLTSGVPAGGTYSGVGINANIFTPNINVLGNNTITYNYTDANGCSNSATQNITVNASPFASATTTNATCNGLTDGSATLTISGGTPSYTTNWGGNNPTALSAGNYGYTVTDINGCAFSDSIIIYEPGIFTASVNTTNVSCNGANNGTASVQLQGSSSPAGTVSTLSYCASTPGSTTASTIDNVQLLGDIVSINNNTAGICDQYEDYTNLFADVTEGQPYTIDVDLGDCSNNYSSGGKVYIDWNIDGDFNDPGEEVGVIPYGPASSASISITVPFSGAYGATRMRIVSQFLNNVPVSSIGPCDVGVMANPVYIQPWFGATEDYSIVISAANITATYIWSNGLTTDSISGLSAGSYMVDITNANGCTITDSVSISQPEAITANAVVTNTSCYGVNDGIATITINGGIPNYTINVLNYTQTLLAGLNTFTTPPLLAIGTYYYSVVDSNNCILNDTVTISSPIQIATTTNITDCDNYLWNTVNFTSSGLITDTLTANNGCDSIATVNLTINNSSTSLETRTECDSYLWNGITCTTSGNYSYNTINAVGCDSIASLDITVNYSTSTLNSITSCDNYLWSINNQNYTNSGIDTMNSTNNNGCPHVDSLILLINYSNSSNDTIMSCNSYIWNGVNYTTSGAYSNTLINASGCDSIANLALTIADTTGFKINTSVCDSFIWPTTGITYTNTGIFTYTSVNLNTGCPNIDTLDLIIMPNTSSLNSITNCDSHLWNGNIYTTSGIFSDTLINGNGCDSIAMLNLTINNSSGGLDAQVHCDSYIWVDGITYTASNNNATWTYTNASGCDSVVTLDLTINASNYGSQTISSCNSYDWNGQVIYTTGVYTQTLYNLFGCDSVATLNLVVSDTTTSFAAINACNNYTWSVNGTTYNTSGAYIDLSANAMGCVHIDSLILAVNYNSGSYSNVTECDSYLWNNQLLTLTGIYDSLFINSNGCDSLATLNLTINNSSSSDFSITACNEYTWNTAIYPISGTYTQIFPNSIGCDSMATLNLTIIAGSLDITTTISVNHVNCFNLNNGKIQLFPNGGIPPYSYNWSSGETSSYINNLDTGLYSFTILDSLNCSLDSSVTITQPAEIQAILSLTDDTICRYESSEIIIDIINASTNLFTIIIEDSIQKSYMIDSLGLVLPAHIPIALTPNYNSNITLISITDENGCSNTTINPTPIIVNQLPNLNLQLTDICSGTPSFNFPIDSVNEGTPLGGNYFIDNVNTAFFDVENLKSGAYSIRYEYTDLTTLCFNTIEKIININPMPTASFKFSPQPADMENPNIYFRNISAEIIGSIWNLGDGTIVNDSLTLWHTYTDTGKYIITYIVNNQFNCTDTLIDSLRINPIYQSFIPNSFTPNDDDINDVFKPNIMGERNYIMTIFNKWGEKIFEAENEGWDGKKSGQYVQHGAYSYSIVVTDFKNKPFKYTGIIRLLK